MKYSELISKDAQEASKFRFTISQSKLQAAADLLAVEQQRAELECRLEQAKSTTIGFSLTKIAEIQYELNRLNDVYSLMEKLNKELF